MAYYLSSQSTFKASHVEFALVGGLSISQALLVTPLVTLCRKHIGMRYTLLMGSTIVFVALVTSSFATKLWQLVLSQGFCFGWGMGFLYVTSSAVLPPWFSTKRSLAVGISTSGAGIGGLLYSLVTNYAIDGLGVAWTYRLLAFCSVAANIPSSVLLKESGGRVHSSLDELKFNHRDFGRIEVLLIVFWGVATELGYITLLYSLPSYALSVGLTSTQGSIANALLNVGLAVGRPLVGYFSDTLGRINMALATTALCAIFCFALWIPAKTFTLLATFAILAGAICGTFWATVTPILVEVVGLQKLASTFGVVCLSMVLPTTFAEPVAMQLVDSHGDDTKSFMKAQIFVGSMFVVGGMSLWLLRCWKIFLVENERSGVDVSTTMAARSGFHLLWLTPRLFFRYWHV
jgi:MFS family permease